MSSNEHPHIEGYRILRVIGHGGMSTVYLAEQLSLGRRVALKVMLAEALADEVSRARFENEARTMLQQQGADLRCKAGTGLVCQHSSDCFQRNVFIGRRRLGRYRFVR